MAERKATNKYYPPEWDPSKGSINKFVGQHPLRERAKKLSEGILVVRFEMPFNIWCLGCNAHIGKGVRYNAEKKQAGNYFSTRIWNFRMKCHLCDNIIQMQTDPKNRDFTVVSGGKRKTETWDQNTEETGTVELIDPEESKRLATDPFYKLEKTNLDKNKAKEQFIPILEKLQDIQETKKDDFLLSYMARKKFRQEKKEIETMYQEAESKGLNNMMLLPAEESDIKEAKNIVFKSKPSSSLSKSHSNSPSKSLLHNSIKQKLKLKSKSIFGDSYSSSNTKEKVIDTLSKKRAFGSDTQLKLVGIDSIKKPRTSMNVSFTDKTQDNNLIKTSSKIQIQIVPHIKS